MRVVVLLLAAITLAHLISLRVVRLSPVAYFAVLSLSFALLSALWSTIAASSTRAATVAPVVVPARGGIYGDLARPSWLPRPQPGPIAPTDASPPASSPECDDSEDEDD